LGEFEGDDKIIVFTAKDQFYTTGYDVGHHFPEDTVRVEKYDSSKIYTVAYWDDTIKKFYLKRFMAETTDKLLSFVDEENPKSRSLCISDEPRPALEVIYGGVHSTKPSDLIDAVEFIGVKGYKAKGKRISTFEIDRVRFVPQHFAPTPDEQPTEDVEQEPVEEPTEPIAEVVDLIVEEPEVESTENSEPAQEPVDVATEEPEPIVQEVVVLDSEGEEVERITEVVKPTSEVELEIIVPAEEDDSKGPQITQLDLF
jgi:topoisomerase-4 subunit A